MSNFITVNRPFNDLSPRHEEEDEEEARKLRARMKRKKFIEEKGMNRKSLSLSLSRFYAKGNRAQKPVCINRAQKRGKESGRALNLVNLDFIR